MWLDKTRFCHIYSLTRSVYSFIHLLNNLFIAGWSEEQQLESATWDHVFM